MATSGSGTSAVATPVFAGSYTLAQLVLRWRARLDDLVEKYQWSSPMLTEFADNLQKQIINEMGFVPDRTTPEVCTLNVVVGEGLFGVSRRINSIISARLASATNDLYIRDANYMDKTYGTTWHAAVPGTEAPHTLVTSGMGQDVAFLYPPLVVATDTLALRVIRAPQVDLDWTLHQGESLEIDRFAHLLPYGIMWQAYTTNDGDAGDAKKAEACRVLWEGADGHGGDKERIRRMIIQLNNTPKSATPMLAFM